MSNNYTQELAPAGNAAFHILNENDKNPRSWSINHFLSFSKNSTKVRPQLFE